MTPNNKADSLERAELLMFFITALIEKEALNPVIDAAIKKCLGRCKADLVTMKNWAPPLKPDIEKLIGADRYVVVGLLAYQFAGLPPDVLPNYGETRQTHRWLKDQVRKLGEQAQRMATRIRELREAGPLMDFDVRLLGLPFDLYLDAYAAHLTEFTVVPYLREHTLNRAFGKPDYPLALLASYVRQSTGKPHWAVITSLMNAADFAWHVFSNSEVRPPIGGRFNEINVAKLVLRYRRIHGGDIIDRAVQSLVQTAFNVKLPSKPRSSGPVSRRGKH